jgi:hypothetical protein
MPHAFEFRQLLQELGRQVRLLADILLDVEERYAPRFVPFEQLVRSSPHSSPWESALVPVMQGAPNRYARRK